MSDVQAKLAVFWQQDRPAVSDASFRLTVLEQRARRRFHRSAALAGVVGALALATVTIMAPRLSASIVALPVNGTMPTLSMLGTCAALLWAFMRSRQTF